MYDYKIVIISAACNEIIESVIYPYLCKYYLPQIFI